MDKITLRLFGAFRAYTSAPTIELEVTPYITVAELRPLIVKHLTVLRPDLGKSELVFDSAIANDREILKEEDRIAGTCTLAILPPVCGG